MAPSEMDASERRGKDKEEEGNDAAAAAREEQDPELLKERGGDRSKDRHREKEREKEKEKEKEKERLRRDRDKDKERERDRGKDREDQQQHHHHHHYHHHDRDRDRENERDAREKERNRERERERDHGRDKLRQGSKDFEKDSERERIRDAAKHRDKDKEDRKKERVNDGEKGRDEERGRDTDPSKLRKKEKRDTDNERENGRGWEKEKEKEKANRDKGKEREREKSVDREVDTRSRSAKEESRGGLEVGEIDLKAGASATAPTTAAIGIERKENEIFAWVNKSRDLEERKKIEERIKAARTARLLSEQDSAGESEEEEEEERRELYNAKHLAGLKVLHGINEVMEGGAVVLTLKDKGVLDGDDLNDEMDELENLEIAQQRARDAAYKAAKKKLGTYEDKFQNDINAIRTMLPQYDEEMKDVGLELDESGGLNAEGRMRLEELKKKLQGIGDRTYQSLSEGVANVASEFYTQEEMLQFNKPKNKKKKIRKKKETLDLDALEADAKAEGLGDGDHGSRVYSLERQAAAKLEKERAEEELRRSAYMSAYAKAVDASSKLRVPGGKQETREDDDDAKGSVFGAEEDDELERVLQRARQAALKKQVSTESNGSGVGPQAVAAALAGKVDMGEGGNKAAEGVDKVSSNSVVITDVEEFCRSLQLDEILMKRRRAGDDDDAFGEDGEPPANGGGGWTEVKEEHDDDKEQEMEEAEVEAEDEPEKEEVVSEVSVGKGLAGALQLLKERGTLKETVEWGGRNMDKKKSKLVGITDKEEKFRNREIILDRVDEFGRTMTPKEAFRKLSHKFHGKGPGKMKQEKKMKQYEEEMKLKQMSAGDTPLLSMEKMREAQAKMHTPYIVISGHIKPGQTSDPRSGFATVEKASIGSLTPMLGDKKVEHFLGIKRKPDAGNMKPPLPKKPKQDAE